MSHKGERRPALIETARVLESIRPNHRQLTGWWVLLIEIIAVGMVLFQLYTACFGLLLANKQRAIHLAFTLVLVLFLFPLSKKNRSEQSVPWYDLILGALGAVSCLYIVFNFENLVVRAGYLTTTDIVMGIVAILVVMEAARRVVGTILVLICASFLAYCYLGYYIPGYFQHRGFSIVSIIRHMYLTTEGIFGIPLGASANFIFLFILFGVFLARLGIGQVIIDLALALFGRAKGGPAKAAVLASALFGTINGSSVANVVGTGSITIPLMKSIGYKPSFAGAVEAAASTGGQIMPPIMGAAAFIIAEFLGIPYMTVALAAAIPATMYFLGILFVVHFEAARLGLVGLPKDMLPQIMKVMLRKGYLLTPILVLFYLLMKGYTPTLAGFWGIVSSLAISLIKKETRPTLKQLWDTMVEGAKSGIELAAAVAVVGFIVGTATLTGLGLKLAGGIIMLSGGKLLLALVLTMLASLLLGMGVPTTANYVIMATMTVPTLVKMGVLPIAAHLFCFYYGIISDLTLPVALTAVAAAGVAGAPFFPTAMNSLKLALSAYIVPFFFVYSPIILLGTNPLGIDIVRVSLGCIVGTLILSSAVANYLIGELKFYERATLFIGSLLLIDPRTVTDIVGGILIGCIVAIHWLRIKKSRELESSKIEDVPQNI